jgi:hypothetical protein
VSGRALRGYKPGPLPMQKHTAAAAVTAITTPDQGWGGATPRGVIIAAEMGSGKTAMGLCAAELLRQLDEL